MDEDMIDSNALDEMTNGYITAALWADAIPLCTCGAEEEAGGGCLHHHGCATDESGGLDHLGVTAEAWDYVRNLVTAFAEAADGHLIVFADLRAFAPSGGTVWHYIGHDLRLTSGGHGTGFWDREPEPSNMRDGDAERFAEAREALSNLARSRPFDRSGGGDVFQIDDTTVDFDRWPLDPNAGPGDR